MRPLSAFLSIVATILLLLGPEETNSVSTHRRSAASDANSFGSAHTRKVDSFPLDEIDWVRLQATYAAQIASHVEHRESLDFIIYGDSITESLRGTFRGHPHKKAADIPAVWESHFGSWKALPLGIAGDRTVNLLWRVTEGGESQVNLTVRTVVVQIGTNDFYNHYEQLWGAVPMSEVGTIVAEITAGVIASALALRERQPASHLVLLGILPRGDVLPGKPSSEDYHYRLPSMFYPHISEINKRLKAFAESQHSVTYLDCGSVFIKHTAEGMQIDRELMADALHPTARGIDKFLGCLKPHLLPLSHHHRKAEGINSV